MARAAIIVAVISLLGLPFTAHATELWSKGDASLSVSGQIRQIGRENVHKRSHDTNIAVPGVIRYARTQAIAETKQVTVHRLIVAWPVLCAVIEQLDFLGR